MRVKFPNLDLKGTNGNFKLNVPVDNPKKEPYLKIVLKSIQNYLLPRELLWVLEVSKIRSDEKTSAEA